MKPPLRREVRLAPDAGHLFLEAAAVFAQAAEDSVAAKGSFDIALAGGSTPRPLFAVLVSTPEFRNRIAWDKVRFFWGDERPVGPDHPENNYRMAHEALLAHLPVREDRIFRITANSPTRRKPPPATMRFCAASSGSPPGSRAST